MNKLILKCCLAGMISFLASIALAQPRMVMSGETRCAVRSWFHPGYGHHFYAPAAEPDPAGWAKEGIRFVTWARKTSSNHTSLYRMFRPGGGHFYTTNPQERNSVIARGFVDEGHIGYVYTQKFDGLVALHRWWKPKLDRHFYSTSKEEGDRAGFTYEGVIGYVLPANTASSNELGCRVGILDQAATPPAPSWVSKDERCFGAVGSGCGGWLEGSLYVINKAAAYLSARYLSINTVNTLAVGCVPWMSHLGCWVSTGSIKHDNCCLRNPNGHMCGGNESEAVCTAEWEEAVRASLTGRVWNSSFFGRQRADLTPTPSPRNRYPLGEVKETARLCAPSGTHLDDDQVAFCCSGIGQKYFFLNERWLQCVDRSQQGINSSPIQASGPPAVIIQNSKNLQRLLSGEPRANVAVVIQPRPNSPGMGATAQTDSARKVQACLAEAKAKGTDPRICQKYRPQP